MDQARKAGLETQAASEKVMNGEQLARAARDVCLTSLKNPHKSHEDVGQDVYDLIHKELVGEPCVRCGNLYGAGGHGPGFCIDRRGEADV
jgi:hypothetical protein